MLVISIFVGKIELNFHYKKMTEKMYDNLLEKFENCAFQVSNICKAFSNFDFNLTTRKKIHWVINCLKIKSKKGFVN